MILNIYFHSVFCIFPCTYLHLGMKLIKVNYESFFRMCMYPLILEQWMSFKQRLEYNGNVIVEASLYIYWKIRHHRGFWLLLFWLCFRFNLLFLPFYFHVMHPMENEDLIDKYKKSIQCGFNVVLYWRKLLFVLLKSETYLESYL